MNTNNIKGKSDFYSRMGIDIRYVRNLGIVLGIPVSRHFRFLAELACAIKMKY